MNIGVRYTGTAQDYSGYGSANRAFITALYIAGVDVTTELLRQVGEHSDNGWTGALSQNLEKRAIPYKIKIIHLTPDMYPRYMEANKYHIGHLFWETDKLPKEWIEPCNKMGEIWTSSDSMAQVFKASGVKVPIYSFPQPIDIGMADKSFGRYSIPGHKGYMFYAMFQWIERKNPKVLLQAYWEAFTGRRDVTLLLKTYRVNFNKDEFLKIEEDITRWKREFRLPHYPQVVLIRALLDHDKIYKLHQTGDCYVSADHGEGWSRCLHEALLMGKPAISTARGGIHEYLSTDHYFPIPSTYVPVKEVPWIPYYKEGQKWADIDKEKLKEAMLFAFANRDIVTAKGALAKEYIKNTFSYHKVGEKMRKRLEQIQKSL
jgi:glycosyltransferase involved in cell wall biosynthesis